MEEKEMKSGKNSKNGAIRLHRLPENSVYKRGTQIPRIVGIDKSKKEKEIEDEGILRMEIGQIITDHIFQNKSLAELIELLNNNKNYRKYGKYFQGWIEDKLNKKQEIINTINKKMREGLSNQEIKEEVSKIKKFHKYRHYFEGLISETSGNNEKVH